MRFLGPPDFSSVSSGCTWFLVSPRSLNFSCFNAFFTPTSFSSAHAAASRASLRRAASSRAASSFAEMVYFLAGAAAAIGAAAAGAAVPRGIGASLRRRLRCKGQASSYIVTHS